MKRCCVVFGLLSLLVGSVATIAPKAARADEECRTHDDHAHHRLPPANPHVVRSVRDAFLFAAERVRQTVNGLKTAYPTDYALKFPSHTRDDGTWYYKPVTDWRSGFFPGVLWQMYGQTEDALWRQDAHQWTDTLEAMKDNPIDHDQGFRFCLSFGNGYALSTAQTDPDGSYGERAKQILLAAAAGLDRRFNQGGIPVGAMCSEDDWPPDTHYPVYVDSMMNLCLYFSAWDLSGRPSTGTASTWYEHALSQADTIMRQNVRADGSTYHIVEHNNGVDGLPADGTVLRKITDQGFAPESTWSRGQAWAIYGFSQVYQYARQRSPARAHAYLQTARATADYFIQHLPNNYWRDPYNYMPFDFVPPADFDAALGEPPGPYSTNRAGTHTRTRRDSSAAAIAAAGLLLLSTLDPDDAARARYFLSAQEILHSLLRFRGPDGKLAYLAKDSVHRGILAGGSVIWDTGNNTNSLIYGDYYLLEAMDRYVKLAHPSSPPHR
jgi:unsaturated chondroitin disaccharide hydrolase